LLEEFPQKEKNKMTRQLVVLPEFEVHWVVLEVPNKGGIPQSVFIGVHP
jgi:hypothetical protein